MIDHAWRYSADCPEGRLFHIEDLASLGPEWLDSPASLDLAPPVDERIDAYRAGARGWRKEDFVSFARDLGVEFDEAQPLRELRPLIDAAL